MFVLACSSYKGGVGRTSLVASLATIFALRGINVLVVELDPQNIMGVHLGLKLSPVDGLAPRLLANQHGSESALRNSDGVIFLPFGSLTPLAQTQLQERLSETPDYLANFLTALDFGPDTIVLIDSAVAPTIYAQQALRAANFVLQVVLCDPASYNSLPAMDAFRAHHAHHSSQSIGHVYLVNQVNATRPMRRELLALFKQTLQNRLLPIPIHQDDAVAEALLAAMTIPVHAPHSQAAHDLQGVADWLLAKIPFYAARTASHKVLEQLR